MKYVEVNNLFADVLTHIVHPAPNPEPRTAKVQPTLQAGKLLFYVPAVRVEISFPPPYIYVCTLAIHTFHESIVSFS
jgi:hypothetical protein